MFENEKIVCEAHGYPYKIIGNHFYWQTYYETRERYQDKNGIWRALSYPREFFNTLKTEKEIFLSMICRILKEKVADEELRNYYYEIDDTVTIINANLEKTNFYFDENGALDFFE